MSYIYYIPKLKMNKLIFWYFMNYNQAKDLMDLRLLYKKNIKSYSTIFLDIKVVSECILY